MNNWWHTELGEFSPINIALSQWVPAVVTIFLGGILASIIFPRWQDRYIRRKLLTERMQAISEEAAELLNAYTTSWRRLIEISAYEQSLDPSSPNLASIGDKKHELASKRSIVHDQLMACLSRAKLFLDSEGREKLGDFIVWAESHSTKQLDELPEPMEWRKWEDRVLQALQSYA